MAGDETEFNVMLCAQGGRQPLAIHLDHYFVCSTWLKQEFPKHLELIEVAIDVARHRALERLAPQLGETVRAPSRVERDANWRPEFCFCEGSAVVVCNEQLTT